MALTKSACSFAFQAPAISDVVTMRVSIDSTTLTEQHVEHGTSSTLYASPGESQRHDETCDRSVHRRPRWPARARPSSSRIHACSRPRAAGARRSIAM
jgi:hypothetical protein